MNEIWNMKNEEIFWLCTVHCTECVIVWSIIKLKNFNFIFISFIMWSNPFTWGPLVRCLLFDGLDSGSFHFICSHWIAHNNIHIGSSLLLFSFSVLFSIFFELISPSILNDSLEYSREFRDYYYYYFSLICFNCCFERFSMEMLVILRPNSNYIRSSGWNKTPSVNSIAYIDNCVAIMFETPSNIKSWNYRKHLQLALISF